MHEAMLYDVISDGKISNKTKCNLCNHRCIISEGKTGICGVRKNVGGILYSQVYGKAVSANVDPIEKKPLFHFLPASKTFSFATTGCNFRCDFCQNYDISQPSKKTIISRELPPEDAVKMAVKNNCRSIAYTYTEPTVFFEYAYDTMKLAKKKNLKNIWVTNGYYTAEALEIIKPCLDAANIDLKSMDEKFYLKTAGAKLQHVLDSVKLTHEAGIWIEITTLLIPGYNDSDSNLRKIAEFIASIDKDMPWHISRFYPMHKLLDAPPTSMNSLKRAYMIGKDAGLHYVYLGNVFSEHENTFCSRCNEKVIERIGYAVKSNLRGNKCPECSYKIAGVFEC